MLDGKLTSNNLVVDIMEMPVLAARCFDTIWFASSHSPVLLHHGNTMEMPGLIGRYFDTTEMQSQFA